LNALQQTDSSSKTGSRVVVLERGPMPLHDFYCPHCSYSMTNQWIQEVEFIRLCPRCDTVMKTVLGKPALRFKGEGWESNDYKPKEKPDGR